METETGSGELFVFPSQEGIHILGTTYDDLLQKIEELKKEIEILRDQLNSIVGVEDSLDISTMPDIPVLEDGEIVCMETITRGRKNNEE